MAACLSGELLCCRSLPSSDSARDRARELQALERLGSVADEVTEAKETVEAAPTAEAAAAGAPGAAAPAAEGKPAAEPKGAEKKESGKDEKKK